MTILDRNAGTFASATSFNVTRSSGSYGTGTVIVVAVFGNTVVTTPGSWTQRLSSVVNLGLYSYDKTAAGESSITFNCSTGSGVWFAWELSAGSTFMTPGSVGQNAVGASFYTTGTLTPTAGDRHLLLAAGGVGSGAARTVSYNIAYTEFADLQATSQDWPFAAGADRDITADGITGYSTTATFSGATLNSAGAIWLVYNNAAGTTSGAASLASTSTLTAAASVIRPGAAALASTSTLTAAAATVRAGTAALASTSTLTAVAAGRPYFRAATSALGTAGTCTLTIPASVVAGDVMMITAVFKVATSTDTIATPSGWSVLVAPVNGAGASYQTAEYILTATGGSAGSTVVVAGTIPSAQQINAVLAAYGGANPTPRSAALATNGTTAATNVDAASATTVANDLIVYTGGVRGSVNGPASEPTFTGPGAMRVQSAATSAAAQNVAVFLGDDGETAGLRTITASRTAWSTAGQTILVPSAVAGAAVLASTSALTAGASVIVPGTAVLASTSTLTASTATTVSGTASLASTSALTATAATVRAGVAVLASTSTLTATAVRLVPASASLASVSGLTGTAATVIAGTAVLASTSTLVAFVGSVNQPGRLTATAAAPRLIVIELAPRLTPTTWP